MASPAKAFAKPGVKKAIATRAKSVLTHTITSLKPVVLKKAKANARKEGKAKAKVMEEKQVENLQKPDWISGGQQRRQPEEKPPKHVSIRKAKSQTLHFSYPDA